MKCVKCLTEDGCMLTKFIDPKNPHTVGKSAWNLGNHILLIMFVLALLFVVKSSYPLGIACTPNDRGFIWAVNAGAVA